ncbi:MAG: tripartite tricarboxylate transporter TctB family protein [Burkholderiaceae bacterium]
MKFNDAVIGLLLLVLGAVVLFIVKDYPTIPGQQVGPALFPGLIAVGLCIGGAMLVVRGWHTRVRVPWLVFDDWVRSPRHVLAFAVLIGSVLFYILVSQWLGFILSAVLILFTLFRVLRVSMARSALIAVVATLVIHVAFYKLLRVPLPWGVLTPYAW